MTIVEDFPAVYGGGKYLRRWALVGGAAKCVLPPLTIADSHEFELDAARAHNLFVAEVMEAVEEYENAQRVLGIPAPVSLGEFDFEFASRYASWEEAHNTAQDVVSSVTQSTLNLLEKRDSESAPEAVLFAVLDENGRIVDMVAADNDWTPPSGVAVAVDEVLRVGGTLIDGVYTPPGPVLNVPASVTNFQARAILRTTIAENGKSLETIVRDALWEAKQAASTLPESDLARIQADHAWLAWEQSNEFLRYSPLVDSWIEQLGMTDAEVDALFVAAEKVDA